MVYVKGIDISNNDGQVDFSKIANDGVRYVYLKATEGKSFKDGYMDEFYNGAKAQGLKLGSYHFLVGTSSPEEQAQNFYAKIKDYDWDLVPMMDIETNFDGLSDYVVRFINAFKQLSPLQLGIYSYTGFIDYISDISETIKDMPFWEANYNNSPWSLKDNFFTNRIGHQYTETGSISGVNCNCDVNSFTDGVLLNNISKSGQWITNDKGQWWYKHDDGSYTTNGWEYINKKWYMFDSQGWMLYDWKRDGNGYWYYLGDSQDGSMKSGWLLKNSKWFYLADNGQMLVGWQKIKNNWYYFYEDGTMAVAWFKDTKGNSYLTYSTGELITNIDIYGYHFDQDGHPTKL
jgi:GH25 family lysozyme M1 (1,4-beta-N-acetylmuramidase)